MILWHYVTQRRSLLCPSDYPAGVADLLRQGGRFRPEWWPICSGTCTPIIVWLDKIGVHENGEEGELFREFNLLLLEPGKGEVQVGLVISDGKNTKQIRLPNKDSYELNRDEVIQVNALVFETQEVGDYLRFFATAYEDDGGLGEQVIYKVLDLATGSYIGMPTSILMKLSGVNFAEIYAEIFGYTTVEGVNDGAFHCTTARRINSP